ncbi:transposon Tn10 TetD protein [Ruminiclostridium hungatei]|uniref:Transposon Tn10 TetD protein n=1 Tax=Ruminiclostridium hungatei TaxID=48256 RepID=A0A1V4SK18_RUMHU|nr:AraC family transcriptional regulator [Ruminiclostridium hungatei]OPX44228.1 transposon Tn10 TetD protein [Ruminiclostridium hungatei]
MTDRSDTILHLLDKEIHGTHITSVYTITAPYHRHNGYEIYLFLQGNIRYYIEDHCYDLRKGDMVLINKKEMHRAVCMEQHPYERISIYISEAYMSQLSSENTNLAACFNMRNQGENNVIRLSEEDSARFVKLAGRLILAEKKKNFGDDIMIRACAEQILILANQAYMDSNHVVNNIMPELIRNVMNYIEQNIPNEITLDNISERFYLDGTHISRLFKKHTGLTIRSYIVARRVACARELLGAGKSVTEAGALAGFNNYANFIRTFHRIEGIPPGQYAKEHGSPGTK